MNTQSIHHRKCIYIHTVSVYRLFITTFSQYFLLLTRITGATSWPHSSDKVASVSLRCLNIQMTPRPIYSQVNCYLVFKTPFFASIHCIHLHPVQKIPLSLYKFCSNKTEHKIMQIVIIQSGRNNNQSLIVILTVKRSCHSMPHKN